MRSALVFAAECRVSNPFLLCHLTRMAIRSFHQNGMAMQETINKALELLSKQDCAAKGVNANAVVAVKLPSAA